MFPMFNAREMNFKFERALQAYTEQRPDDAKWNRQIPIKYSLCNKPTN